jgi:hypothetical protein
MLRMPDRVAYLSLLVLRSLKLAVLYMCGGLFERYDALSLFLHVSSFF